MKCFPNKLLYIHGKAVTSLDGG